MALPSYSSGISFGSVDRKCYHFTTAPWRQYPIWLPLIPFCYLCPWRSLPPWGWAGSRDLLQMSRIGQVMGCHFRDEVIEDCDVTFLALSLALLVCFLLWRKQQRSTWLGTKGNLQPIVSNEWCPQSSSPQGTESCPTRHEWDFRWDCSPCQHLEGSLKGHSNPEDPAKPCLDSQPTETVR